MTQSQQQHINLLVDTLAKITKDNYNIILKNNKYCLIKTDKFGDQYIVIYPSKPNELITFMIIEINKYI
jgi:hypothetical protein